MTTFVDCQLRRAELEKSDFSGATCKGTTFRGAAAPGALFRGASLSNCNFQDSQLLHAMFGDAQLRQCLFEGARLGHSNFDRARLLNCDFRNADMNSSSFERAQVRQTSLSRASLLFSNFRGALIEDSNLEFTNLSNVNAREGVFRDNRIYGISVWGGDFSNSEESELVITRSNEFQIKVSSFEFGLFVHQCINNENMRKFFDTSAENLVLILGRFTPERKKYLDVVRVALQHLGYVPIIFDFEKPESKDLTQTILALALMVRFIVADLSEPSSAPHEIATIAPQISAPIAPMIEVSLHPYAMFVDLKNRYRWVLGLSTYNDVADLMKKTIPEIVEHCEKYIMTNPPTPLAGQ